MAYLRDWHVDQGDIVLTVAPTRYRCVGPNEASLAPARVFEIVLLAASAQITATAPITQDPHSSPITPQQLTDAIDHYGKSDALVFEVHLNSQGRADRLDEIYHP